MPHPAKETRHRSTRTVKSMARLALGPLILTGLFLAGSLCTVSARAETIDLASQPGFHTIYRDWIEDGSTLRLKTDFVSGRTDQVIINYWQDWEGQFRIHVTPTGAESGIPETDFLAHLLEGAQVNCSLTNPGGKVDMGVYVYELARRELPIPPVVEEAFYAAPDTEGAFYVAADPEPPIEWYLRRVEGEKSPTAETVLGLSGMASSYAMWMGQLSDLRERLGEIRYGNGTDGLWVRGFTEKNRLSGLAGIDFSQNFYGTSFGYDRLMEQDKDNRWLLGLRGQLTRAEQKIDGLHGGSGDSRSYGIAAYATWQHTDGWYSDTVLTWDWYDQNFKTRMLDGTRVYGSYNTYAGGISQELGRMFRFDNGCFIEPQLQLSWYWMKGMDFTTSNGMKVEQDDAYALTGRAGLVLGKKWDLSEDRYFQPYLKGGVNHEFMGDQKVTVNGIAFSDDLRGTRIYYGTGFDVQFAPNARFYAEFEREDGHKASTPWSVSAGLRVAF